MKTATFGRWHAWESNRVQVILSDETARRLRYFDTWDELITWLYVNDNKDAARAINNEVKP